MMWITQLISVHMNKISTTSTHNIVVIHQLPSQDCGEVIQEKCKVIGTMVH